MGGRLLGAERHQLHRAGVLGRVGDGFVCPIQRNLGQVELAKLDEAQPCRTVSGSRKSSRERTVGSQDIQSPGLTLVASGPVSRTRQWRGGDGRFRHVAAGFREDAGGVAGYSGRRHVDDDLAGADHRVGQGLNVQGKAEVIEDGGLHPNSPGSGG